MNEVAIIGCLRGALPGLAGIWLFGSQAGGDAGPASDVDLAVLVDGKANPLDLWHIAAELATIAGRPVDLVDLRDASTVMQSQIVTKGRRLWSRDAGPALYELAILREKMDFDVARAGLMADIARTGKIHER